MSTRVQTGDKAPTHECVWKQLDRETIAIKVDYLDDQGQQLYAVFAYTYPHPWPNDLQSQLIATGEHLTLDQVIERSKDN